MLILTPPEIHRLLAHADQPIRTLLLRAVMTGMRRGELRGLKWEDIDFEASRIHVRRAVWRGKFVTPKSRRSRRAIDMTRTLKEALARLPSRFRSELVFCTESVANSDRATPLWRTIDGTVPVLSSAWSGTGTVVVPSAVRRCITT